MGVVDPEQEVSDVEDDPINQVRVERVGWLLGIGIHLCWDDELPFSILSTRTIGKGEGVEVGSYSGLRYDAERCE